MHVRFFLRQNKNKFRHFEPRKGVGTLYRSVHRVKGKNERSLAMSHRDDVVGKNFHRKRPDVD